MSRVIIPEKQSETTKPENSELLAETSVSNDLTGKTGEVIITASEMEKAFDEWEKDGKSDFVTNPDLAERIRAYLAYQEELDPLKEALAARIFKPYVHVRQNGEKRDDWETSIYINGVKVCAIKVFSYASSGYNFMSIADFKKILLYLKNPYAVYMKDPADKGCFTPIDVCSYIIKNGGTYIDTNSKVEITI